MKTGIFHIYWKPLIISLLISLGTGGLSALLTSGSMNEYQNLNQPPLAPPGSIFPIVWTILFFLMGISCYGIWTAAHTEKKKQALWIYGIQLFMNFCWSIFFFLLEWRLFAFIWLIGLWIMILAMIITFKRIRPWAGWLQVPYLLWVTFAGYLNLAVYLLNR